MSKSLEKISEEMHLRKIYNHKEKYLLTLCFVWGAILLFLVYSLTQIPVSQPDLISQTNEDFRVRYVKDLYSHSPWPDVEQSGPVGKVAHQAAHYFWCGEKIFRFEDYLGLLSVVRILKPSSVVFHYNVLPFTDENVYHTWFLELRHSVRNFQLVQAKSKLRCGTNDVLDYALSQLASNGGVYIGERTLLSRFPIELFASELSSYNTLSSETRDVTQGLIYSRSGFPEDAIPAIRDRVLKSKNSCYSTIEYDSLASASLPTNPCVVISEHVYPRDIWNGTTKFSELSRWLFYGRREPLQVTQGPEDDGLIPMTSHIVWAKPGGMWSSEEFQFLNYLSVVSALYVAGFESVIVYSQSEPRGEWWERLRGENVTFVKVDEKGKFYKNSSLPGTFDGELSLASLLQQGGAYQDQDIIWVNEIPNSIRRYPAVVCKDWARRGEWPEFFNMGVVLAKPNADWLKRFSTTFGYGTADKWALNSPSMPYRAYEQAPDQVYVDSYLQVICYRGICHPTWKDDYLTEIDNFQPIINYDWREARAFHFIVPKPPRSLTSPDAIKTGFGMFAEMGRMVLEKSGNSDLLK